MSCLTKWSLQHKYYCRNFLSDSYVFSSSVRPAVSHSDSGIGWTPLPCSLPFPSASVILCSFFSLHHRCYATVGKEAQSHVCPALPTTENTDWLFCQQFIQALMVRVWMLKEINVSEKRKCTCPAEHRLNILLSRTYLGL